MKFYEKEELEEKVRISHSFKELARNLGLSGESYNQIKTIKRFIDSYQIDVSHFDPNYANKKRRKYPDIEKECPICKVKFITRKGISKEPTYCSRDCANIPQLGKRHSKESNLKTSKTLLGDSKWIDKKCEYCDNTFKILDSRKNSHKNGDLRRFCSTSCGSKNNWGNEDYRKRHSEMFCNLLLNKKVGWLSHGDVPFSELVYIKFLNENGFADRYHHNFTVNKKEYDSESKSCYFLDFYFPHLNLDLEIDGEQHEQEKRKIHDEERTKFLENHGFIVYRIKWKEIQSKKGKEFLKEQQQNLLNFIKNLEEKTLTESQVSPKIDGL
jgi:hypothetical protein